MKIAKLDAQISLMAYPQLWIDEIIRSSIAWPVRETLAIKLDYNNKVFFSSPPGWINQKSILFKHFINMNRLFQPIIAEYWNEDTMIPMEKYFMLKLNLISRMVFGFQVYLTPLVVITLPFFRDIFISWNHTEFVMAPVWLETWRRRSDSTVISDFE